jgi:hypothetical protein
MASPAALAATAGLTEVDRLNVCDSAAEAAHGYRVESWLGDLRLNGAVQRGRYDGASAEVMDAGRVVFGSEELVVQARKGRDLVVVLRTSPTAVASVFRPAGAGRYTIAVPKASLELAAQGRVVQKMEFAPGAAWDEVVLRIDGNALGEEGTRLRLRGNYTSYYYWFFQ